MNILKRYFIILVIPCVLTFSAHGVLYYVNGMEDITTPELSNALVAATHAAKQRDYSRACSFLDDALALNYSPEFELQDDINGPLELQILSMKAFFMSRPYKQGDPAILQLAQDTIQRFKETGEDTRCHPYIDLHHRVIEYYTTHENYEKAQEAADAMLLLDPGQIQFYLMWAYKRVPSSVIEEKIDAYEAKYGTVEPYMAFLRIRILKDRGENVFNATRDFIKNNPTMEFDIALKFLRASVDTANIENVREYHNLLTWWALNQPSDEAHVARVARLMNEKKKIETLVPELSL